MAISRQFEGMKGQDSSVEGNRHSRLAADQAAGPQRLFARADAHLRWLKVRRRPGSQTLRHRLMPPEGVAVTYRTLVLHLSKSRWAERLLGGATRTLLAGTTVPTLMSH